jgi:hypothetical protein
VLLACLCRLSPGLRREAEELVKRVERREEMAAAEVGLVEDWRVGR